MSATRRVAVAMMVCDGPCAASCEASAPILGDDPIALEQAHRVARRNACVLAEQVGWRVAEHGKRAPDLCPSCAERWDKAVAAKEAAA